jgi:archaellum biogenesis protein FlaJ (TadC family)
VAVAEEEVAEVSNSRSQRPNDRYGSNQIRPGFLPGLLGSAAAVAGLWANGTEWMITILFVVSIFAAIIFFFCIQALRADDPASKNQRVQGQSRTTASVFAALLVIIVVVYNPVMPLVLTASGTFWQLAQVATGAVLFAAGVLVKTPSSER